MRKKLNNGSFKTMTSYTHTLYQPSTFPLASAPPSNTNAIASQQQVQALEAKIAELTAKVAKNDKKLGCYDCFWMWLVKIICVGGLAVLYLFSAISTFKWVARDDICEIENRGINFKHNLIASTAFKLAGAAALFLWWATRPSEKKKDADGDTECCDDYDRVCFSGLSNVLMIISIVGLSVCMFLDGIMLA